MVFQWKGRVDQSNKSKRFHQIVEPTRIDKLQTATTHAYSLIGFSSEEGVRRNKGRLGAKEGPNAIRQQVANLACHLENPTIYDLGDIICVNHDLEKAQADLGHMVKQVMEKKYFPIILGGGHETAYGHYLGVRAALGKDQSIGIINLDAHFDMRLDKQPSSGTMFRQILEADEKVGYLVLGIQPLSNTRELFTTASDFQVAYQLADQLKPLEHTFAKIDEFCQTHDVIIYTICTDVFNQIYAPGVSAPSPFGIDPETARTITNYIMKQKQTISMDLSEVNPTFDIDNRTSRLISYLIAEAIYAKQESIEVGEGHD